MLDVAKIVPLKDKNLVFACVPLLFLLLLPAIIFVVPWLRGNVYTSFDLSHIMVPIEDLYARYQRAGQIPVWAPEFQGGTPMMANGIESFLYLPHVFLRQWLPGIWVANISLLLHLWLAGLGMWLLLRYNKLPKTASIGGALVFSLGGYFWGRITLPQIFLSAAWLPLVILSFRYWWDRPVIRRALLFSAVVAAQIISGHIQMAIYTFVLLSVLGIVMVAKRYRFINKRRVITLFFALAMMCALTAVHILPIAELLPISKRAIPLKGEEAFDVSYPVSQMLTWFLPKVFGNQATYVGAKNEPELFLFFGITGVFLGILGLMFRRTWKDWLGLSAVCMIIASFILAAGGYSPLYRFLHTLPVLSGMANPGRAIVLIHLGWSIIAGYGLMALAVWSDKHRSVSGMLAGAGTAVSIFLLLRAVPAGTMQEIAWANIKINGWYLLTAGVLCVLSAMIPKRFALYGNLFIIALLVIELSLGSRHFNPQMPVSAYTNPIRATSLLPGKDDIAPRVYAHKNFTPVPKGDYQPGPGPVIGTHTIIHQQVIPRRNNLSGVDIWLTWDGRPVREGAIKLAVKNLDGETIRESFLSSSRINDAEHVNFVFEPINDSSQPLVLELTTPFKDTDAPKAVVYHNIDKDYNPTGHLSICRKICVAPEEKSRYGWDLACQLRYRTETADFDREMLVPIFGEAAGYKMISGHLQLQLLAVTKYMYELGERNDRFADIVMKNRVLLDRMSVGTILASYDENRSLQGFPGATLRGVKAVNNQYIHVYRNEMVFPRLDVAQKVRTVGSSEEALRLLVQKDIDEHTVTAQNFSEPANLGEDKHPEVLINKDMPTKVVVSTKSASPQLLVLRDVMYPGWRAYIDSKSTEIYIVDSLFRGVLVPSGEHTVEFSFVSTPFNKGAIISGIAWLAMIGFFIVSRVFNRSLG